MRPIATERLILRDWRPEDAAPFAAMNGDSIVMEFFPAPLDRGQSDALVGRIQDHIVRKGFGPRAVELKADSAFLGFVGLIDVFPEAPFAPATEIGWRLARPYWGQGLAEEAARAVLHEAFIELRLAELVSMTAVLNRRSQGLMRRLGMTRDEADDFDHPKIAEDSPLRPHVLYRMTVSRFDEGVSR